MTTEKVSFSERRQALEMAAAGLRAAVDIITAEAAEMRAAEARFAERDKSRKAAKSTRHG